MVADQLRWLIRNSTNVILDDLCSHHHCLCTLKSFWDVSIIHTTGLMNGRSCLLCYWIQQIWFLCLPYVIQKSNFSVESMACQGSPVTDLVILFENILQTHIWNEYLDKPAYKINSGMVDSFISIDILWNMVWNILLEHEVSVKTILLESCWIRFRE